MAISFPPDLSDLGHGESQQTLILEEYVSTHNLPGWLGNQSHDGECGDALSAPGLSNNPQSLSWVQAEIDSVDSPGDPPFSIKVRL